MGEVTLAVKKGSPDVRKLVVLKTLRRDMLGDAAIRKMSSEEACLSARLSHPNVVQVFGVIAADSPVLVMEYLDGKPLSAILKRAGDRCSIAMQLRILSHVLAGLHYSHELRDYDGTPLNIVHRDISPQNVFVTYGGLVKVLDFGLAKVATKRSRTKSGMVKGKLEYMPAEQMIAGEVDRRADIYAVGCMLWQTCSGERLWAYEGENTLVRNVISGNIPRPSTRRPVDPRLEAITMKALAYDPKNRFQTALEFQAAIDDVLRQLPDAPSSDDISKFVSELFEKERQAMAEIIRAAMARPNGRSSAQRELAKRTPSLASMVRRRTPLRPLIAVGIITTLLTVMGAASRGFSNDTKSVSRASLAASPHSVMLRISATPSNAALTVDNWPTHENPVTLRLPQDDQPHEVRAVLTGYESVTRIIRLERDLSLDLVSRKAATAVASTAAAGTASASNDSTNTSLVASGHNVMTRQRKASARTDNSCNPPHYYKDGLKYFKPQCL